jgi:hypothetical protein
MPRHLRISKRTLTSQPTETRGKVYDTCSSQHYVFRFKVSMNDSFAVEENHYLLWERHSVMYNSTCVYIPMRLISQGNKKVRETKHNRQAYSCQG